MVVTNRLLCVLALEVVSLILTRLRIGLSFRVFSDICANSNSLTESKVMIKNQTSPSNPVPFLDIGRENRPLDAEIQAAIANVCRSGSFVMGPECKELEKRIAAVCGAKHGIGCASGSDALLLSLMAYDIGPGDEVIVPSFTFFATASAVWRLGAKPVFVDIDPVTFNLDPVAFEAAITHATRGVIPVHLLGQPADMKAINEIATAKKLVVIEDAAQAIGASCDGQPVGSLGDVGCISFYPTKNLGGFGDGGMLVTSNDELAGRLSLLRSHGMKPRYFHSEVGINSRLDSIQAAVLNIKLPRLEQWTASRQQHAARYGELFKAQRLERYLTLPVVQNDLIHVWNQYTVRVNNNLRDELRDYLNQAGIGTEVYYPIPLHQQACFQSLGYSDGSLPVTERAAKEVLSLPVFPELKPAEIEAVVAQVARFFQSRIPNLPTGVSPGIMTNA